MGLDQSAYRINVKPDSQVDFELDESVERDEIAYWRKHPDMQGWMEKLYREKGGKDQVFNCSKVVLTVKDLDKLEEDVRQSKLPHTEGFFFGRSYGDEMKQDLDFIWSARRAIADGYTVYYSSWW
jgi:hypothetical protein